MPCTTGITVQCVYTLGGSIAAKGRYDANGNITAVQRYGSTGALMDNLGYVYGAGTNRLRHISDAVAAGTFASDIDNQVTDNYAYDANGSMEKDLQRDVAFVVNDIHNQPVSMWKASTGQELRYYYDTEGKRIRKDVGSTEYYVNGPGGETEVVVKGDASGATHSILGRDNLGQVKRSGAAFARYYYLKDHLGTIKMTVNSMCDTVGHDDYYPFGQQMEGRCSASDADPRYKFTEKERDAESGYDYFGARYYDARIGRWSTADPSTATYPEWSPYAYGLNSPSLLRDPNGKWVTDKDKGMVIAKRFNLPERTALRLVESSPAALLSIAYRFSVGDPSFMPTGVDAVKGIAFAGLGGLFAYTASLPMTAAESITMHAAGILHTNGVSVVEALGLSIGADRAMARLDEQVFEQARDLSYEGDFLFESGGTFLQSSMTLDDGRTVVTQERGKTPIRLVVNAKFVEKHGLVEMQSVVDKYLGNIDKRLRNKDQKNGTETRVETHERDDD